MEQSHAVHHCDLGNQRIIEQPHSSKSQASADNTQEETLNHEGEADKAVGSAHHLHDGDLILTVIHGQLDSVGDDQQTDNQQDRNDGRHGTVPFCSF